MGLKLASFAAVACLFATLSCSKHASTPASPTAASPADQGANPDGSTLKTSAPTPQSPINGQRLQQGDTSITLTVANAAPRFGSATPVTYRFQLFNAGGGMMFDVGNIPAGAASTSYTFTNQLEGDQTYSWQSRAEVQNEGVGPWSARMAFVAPPNEGYIRGNELYNPLANGKTVGVVNGPITFVPGVGARLESQLSYIAYQLPATLNEGEFSILVTDMPANTEGDKTKLFAMAQGFDDIVTNDRRMTIEKRGDPAGVVAWRFITHDDQVDTEGAEREYVDFQASHTYFWQATWRSNFFRLIIRDGGVDGRTIYDKGKPFSGRAYDPNPHVVYIGSPVGRSGVGGASVDHVTIRQVWVSGRPRPAFANR